MDAINWVRLRLEETDRMTAKDTGKETLYVEIWMLIAKIRTTNVEEREWSLLQFIIKYLK